MPGARGPRSATRTAGRKASARAATAARAAETPRTDSAAAAARQWRPMSVPPLSITNPSNFRDLAENVRSVPLRPNRLFRSDHLGSLDLHDAQQIRALGIRRVLDFRGVHERTSAECSVPGVHVHSLAIEPTIVQALA